MFRAWWLSLTIVAGANEAGCGGEPTRLESTIGREHGPVPGLSLGLDVDGPGSRDADLVDETDEVGEPSPPGDATARADADADLGNDGVGDANPSGDGDDTETSLGADADAGPGPDADTSMGGDSDTPVAADADASLGGEPLGTFADPIPVDRWPFVLDDDTLLGGSQLDRYGCAPGTGEAGPERVYHLVVEADGELVAELGESPGVDVDLHLLSAPPVAGATEAPCVARANTRLAVEVTAGEYWLVVDSYSNAAGDHAGAYRLAVELTVLDVWQVVEVAPGVVWKRKVYSDYAGGRQSINSLEVDPLRATIRPYTGDGCLHPSVTAPAHGAIAAINAGFFDTGPGTCPPLDLIKANGVLLHANRLTGAAQRAIGVAADGAPLVAWVDADADWPEAWNAVGSYPSLVTAGAVVLEPSKTSDFFVGRHPRTALGVTASGKLLLVTVDGRTAAGKGLTRSALAQHMVNLGAVDAVNLDGGGSTAMWIEGQSVSGVVNSPSDDGDDDHGGERGVSDLLLVVPRAELPR